MLMLRCRRGALKVLRHPAVVGAMGRSDGTRSFHWRRRKATLRDPEGGVNKTTRTPKTSYGYEFLVFWPFWLTRLRHLGGCLPPPSPVEASGTAHPSSSLRLSRVYQNFPRTWQASLMPGRRRVGLLATSSTFLLMRIQTDCLC